jgi:protein-disulfide isomerase
MTASESPARSPRLIAALILVALLGGLAGWLYGSQSLAQSDEARIRQVVRDYLLKNPEILPEAMQRLQQRETQRQLSDAGDGLTKPFAGAVLGNPQGTVTLVEFTDYACGYCRASVPEVEALIAANPQLKVVVRELPILSAASETAARWALAAAEQGKFDAFHRAMFVTGRPDPTTIETAARSAGLDLDRARKFIAAPQVEAELKQNLAFARQLRIDGTPTWIIGEQMFAGAVGREILQKAIDDTRKQS